MVKDDSNKNLLDVEGEQADLLTTEAAVPPQTASQARVQKALDIAQKHAAKRQGSAKNGAALKQAVQLSFFSGDTNQRAFPNILARTPLFAPIRPGRRKMLENELLPAHGTNLIIRYTGKQLDQSDCDVFMQTLFLLRGKDLGVGHLISRSELLRALGKTDGGKNYIWLDETFGRLVSAQLAIESPLYKGRVTLVSKWVEHKETGQWHVVVDEDIKKLFGGEQYSLIDWQRRLKIAKRVDLAKWLQNWTCSHEKGMQNWKVTTLYTLSEYSSPIRKFREALTEAMEELARVGIIIEPTFYENDTKVKWMRL